MNITRDLTDYLYYATWQETVAEANATLQVDSAMANALLVFWDGGYVGQCYNMKHGWVTEKWQCKLPLPAITAGHHSLTLLSVCLGVENGMNPDEIPYETHFKGVQVGGAVRTAGNDFTKGGWSHRAYLTGEWLAVWTEEGRAAVKWETQWKGLVGQPLVWWSAALPAFHMPSGGQWALLLDLTGMNRGHVYFNGHDAGRSTLQHTALPLSLLCCLLIVMWVRVRV